METTNRSSNITYPKTPNGNKLYPDLLQKNQIGEYIRERTGVEVSQKCINAWAKAGVLHLIDVPPRSSNRRWWIRASNIDAVIATHIPRGDDIVIAGRS
jgi:hypothetical protein